MSQLIARYNRLRASKHTDWPAEVAFWWTPDGKVRMNKRGAAINIDRWFTSFDDAAPVIQQLICTGAYKLHSGEKMDPYDNLLFKSAAEFNSRQLVAP